jgi:ketosteroid isomerase-like protein
MSNLIELTNRGYVAFAKGDMETLTEIMHEKIVWHVSGNSQLSGDYDGRDATFGLFAKIGELTAGTLDLSLKNVAQLGDNLTLVIVRASAKNGDKSVNNILEAHVARWENDKMVEFWGNYEDQKVADDFWGAKA